MQLQTAHCLALLAGTILVGLSANARSETRIVVALPDAFVGDSSGRLLIFVEPVHGDGEAADFGIEVSAFAGNSAAVAARDVETFGARRAVAVDADAVAYPTAFSELSPGPYRVQAVLDRNRNYNFAGRGPGDLVSEIGQLEFPLSDAATVVLERAIPEVALWEFPGASPERLASYDALKPHLMDFKLQSQLLSSFWGRPIEMRAWVLLPDDYASNDGGTWPTVFFSGTFGSTHKANIDLASYIFGLEQSGEIPPMIWVFLDYSTPSGPTVFADSVNNGPWGSALTSELIPELERRYRMDSRPSGRLLTGHSSGGWAALWLQVQYPGMFGGAWATAPDPVTFASFLDVNLYQPGANLYRDENGTSRPFNRAPKQATALMSDYARLEQVLGHDGGVFRSFEWVFSPRGADGTPMQMFDRASGAVDPEVVAYWQDHFDIGRQISANWDTLRHDLNGKIHVVVGTADNHFLDGPVRQLSAVLNELGADAELEFLSGKTHNDLYSRDRDPLALLKDIARAMRETARSPD